MKIKTVFILTFFVLGSPALFSQENRFDYFEKAFSGDTSQNPSMSVRFRVFSPGKIKIETGKIISCDVEELHNAIPINQVFPKGIFPVQLGIAKDAKYEFVAYARILFSTNKIKTWKKIDYSAVANAKDSSQGNCFIREGIGVGVFIDSVACKILNAKPHYLWGELFINKLKKTELYGSVYDLNGHFFSAFTGNIYICYSLYIGYDANGKICVLLADLGMIQFVGS